MTLLLSVAIKVNYSFDSLQIVTFIYSFPISVTLPPHNTSSDVVAILSIMSQRITETDNILYVSSYALSWQVYRYDIF